VTLADPELRLADRLGMIRQVHHVQLYESGRPFDQYVNALWEARKKAQSEGRTAEVTCIKLLMNSLIGKLAAQDRCWVDEPRAPPQKPWTHAVWRPLGSDRIFETRSIGYHVQVRHDGGETQESCPQLAAWVYSVGRVRLFEWIKQAGEGQVHYVDTDGLLVSTAAEFALKQSGMVQSGQLGALRVQGVYPSLRIGGIKSYAAPGRTVQAGVDPDWGHASLGVYAGWTAGTVVEATGTGQPPRAESRWVEIPEYHPYRHGTVLPDGRVEPLIVGG
jgi:hypothetical protein